MNINNSKFGSKNRGISRIISLVVVSFLSAAFSLSTVTSQIMNVREFDGFKSTYSLSEIRKLSISSGILTITKNDNSSGSYYISDLRSLIFHAITNRLKESNGGEIDYLATYPNPIANELKIDLSGGGGLSGTINIMNIEGRILISQLVDKVSIVSVDVSRLPPGFYICYYSTGTKVLTTKIIKR